MAPEMIWSSVLTAAIGLLAWTFKSRSDELSRIGILVNKTREELAKEYVTKAEVHADINRVLDRLETLDAKLDRLMERK
jgi:Tfp pilus assembly protein PilO